MNETDILMVTGNRKLNDPELIERQLTEYLNEQVPDIAITGMALGTDQAFAEICFDSGIPVHAFVPFAGQENLWSTAQQDRYNELLDRCESVTTVCDSPSNSAYHIRNAAMVKASNRAVAVHNNSRGGTASTIRLLNKEHIPYTVITNIKR